MATDTQTALPTDGSPDHLRVEPIAGEGRVLVVDDNAINRRVLTSILRRESHVLLTAADGEEAVALARQARPDLILLDIMMPSMDGFAVCLDLKSDPRTEHIPIIFLSALSEAADRIRGLDLGAVDYVTKPFDPGEVRARVRNQLRIQRLTAELRRANDDLRRQQALIDEDLKAAAMIQRSLVPASAPALDAVDLAWRFLPCDRIGGDVFNVVPVGPHHLALYVIDVSGHGVPAAMVTVSLSQSLSPQAGNLCTTRGGTVTPLAPAEVLRRLDREYPIERFDKFCTVAYALLDQRDGHVRYAVAGHPPPLIQRADGAIESLDCAGPIIGLGSGPAFEDDERVLAVGDRLLFYTDGIVEYATGDGELFGDERLRRAVAESRADSLDGACARVLTALERFAGPVAVAADDDITLLAMEYRGSAAV